MNPKELVAAFKELSLANLEYLNQLDGKVLKRLLEKDPSRLINDAPSIKNLLSKKSSLEKLPAIEKLQSESVETIPAESIEKLKKLIDAAGNEKKDINTKKVSKEIIAQDVVFQEENPRYKAILFKEISETLNLQGIFGDTKLNTFKTFTDSVMDQMDNSEKTLKQTAIEYERHCIKNAPDLSDNKPLTKAQELARDKKKIATDLVTIANTIGQPSSQNRADNPLYELKQVFAANITTIFASRKLAGWLQPKDSDNLIIEKARKVGSSATMFFKHIFVKSESNNYRQQLGIGIGKFDDSEDSEKNTSTPTNK